MKSPLLKNIVASVAGYAVMSGTAFVLFTLMWTVLGAEGSFEPGGWEVTGAWIGASTVLGAIVAVAGGFTCARLAASGQGLAILIVMVIVLGILSAMPDAPSATAAAGVRPVDITMFDAMSSAELPAWLRWLNPLIGVVGVILGANLQGGSDAGSTA